MEVINAKTLSKISEDYNIARYGIDVCLKEIKEICLQKAKKGEKQCECQVDEPFNKEGRTVILEKLQELGFRTESRTLTEYRCSIKIMW